MKKFNIFAIKKYHSIKIKFNTIYIIVFIVSCYQCKYMLKLLYNSNLLYLKGVTLMSEKELKKSIEDMKKFTKKVTRSKRASLGFLVKAGICSSDGKLKKQYR